MGQKACCRGVGQRECCEELFITVLLCVCCSQADYRYSEINDKLAGITHKLGDAKVSLCCELKRVPANAS